MFHLAHILYTKLLYDLYYHKAQLSETSTDNIAEHKQCRILIYLASLHHNSIPHLNQLFVHINNPEMRLIYNNIKLSLLVGNM